MRQSRTLEAAAGSLAIALVTTFALGLTDGVAGAATTANAPAPVAPAASTALLSAPTNVVAVPADASTLVSWTPAPAGGPAVTSYTASASPGGASCTAAASDPPRCTITGLTNAMVYKVTVKATGPSSTSKPSKGASVRASASSCAVVASGANLQGCVLSHRNLAGVKLKKTTNMRSTNLVGANLGQAVGQASRAMHAASTAGADLSRADLTGVASGGITGTPTALPSQWTLVNGYLIGPGADLEGAALSGVNLAPQNNCVPTAPLTWCGVNLSGANLSGANLSVADLSGVTSGGIIGTPATLPTYWNLVNGYLVGPT